MPSLFSLPCGSMSNDVCLTGQFNAFDFAVEEYTKAFLSASIEH